MKGGKARNFRNFTCVNESVAKPRGKLDSLISVSKLGRANVRKRTIEASGEQEMEGEIDTGQQ